jgi:DNA primase
MDGIDEVKARISIEDVISEYVQLKRAGRNYKGLSPFTSERTPSFVVSPEKQIWHDFSSGRGGNVFSFVMEMEGLDFKGALELLARKAGVDLEQYRTKGNRYKGPKKERLYELLDLAARFYQVQFSHNKTALEYVLGKRQFSKATALEWRLGYSPNNGTALIDYAKKKGFTEAELKAAGLTSQRFNGIGDMFRGRLMIPLQDPQGKVIGFTARLLEANDQAPKYINTPQTVLYDKSRHVFGLHLAKESIRKSKFVVLVEGNLDVIASHQAGVRQVVATAGTALTEPNLKALSRFTGDIRLSFDADRAGIAATERAIPIASKVGVSLSIIDIPSGKDPDELTKQDPQLWRDAIGKNKYALDWLIERYKHLLDITSAQGKREFSDVLLPVVRSLKDKVEQDHYLRQMAELIDISYDALRDKMNGVAPLEAMPLRKPRVTPAALDKATVEYAKLQDHFLTLMLLQPKLRDYLSLIDPEMFTTDNARQLLTFLLEHPEFSAKPDEIKQLTNLTATKKTTETAESQGGEVQSLADYVKILIVQYDELYQGLELTELQYEAARLQARLVEQYVKHKKQQLVRQMADNPAEASSLLAEVKKLDELLGHVKGGA